MWIQNNRTCSKCNRSGRSSVDKWWTMNRSSSSSSRWMESQLVYDKSFECTCRQTNIRFNPVDCLHFTWNNPIHQGLKSTLSFCYPSPTKLIRTGNIRCANPTPTHALDYYYYLRFYLYAALHFESPRAKTITPLSYVPTDHNVVPNLEPTCTAINPNWWPRCDYGRILFRSLGLRNGPSRPRVGVPIIRTKSRYWATERLYEQQVVHKAKPQSCY